VVVKILIVKIPPRR